MTHSRKFTKLIRVATDVATSMVGKNVGLSGLLKKEESIPDFIPIHCIVHREHLNAKNFNFEHMFTPVIKIVNFIRTSAKNHLQFQNFIDELDLNKQINDLSYCIVRLLYLDVKNQLYPRFKDRLDL